MTTDQLRTRRSQLLLELERLATVSGELDESQRARWHGTTSELERVDAQLADRDDRTRALTGPGVTSETGDGARAAGHYRDVQISRVNDPGETLSRALEEGGVNTRRGGQLLRDAARSSINDWSRRSDCTPEFQESAERAISGSDKYSAGVAEWVTVGSDPVYERAFRTYLTGGPSALMGDEAQAFRKVQGFLSERAMSEGSVAAGQAAVPPALDPLITLSNAGQANSFRQLCTIKTITTQTWRGITSAGVSAEWTAEAAEFTDASPTFAQPTITPVKGDALVQLSWELLEDSSLMADLTGLFADARDRLEATAFCTGLPASTQPTGICSALDLNTASRLSCTTSGIIGVVDLYRMDSALPPRWRKNASWMGNKAVLNEIRQAVNTTVANYSPWVDFAGEYPSKAIGYNVYEASGLSTSTASATDSLILGDFRGGMFLVDRTPSVVAVNPWVLGTNRRPIGSTQVAVHFRVGSDVPVPSAFIMLRR